MGRFTGDESQAAYGSFLMVSTKQVSKTHGLLMSYESWLLCYQPLPTPQLCQSLQYSESVKKEVGLLGSIPHSWGSWAFTHYTFIFPCASLSWHKTVVLWERGSMDKVKLFFLCSSVKLFLDFFAPTMCCILFNWTTRFPQRYSHL